MKSINQIILALIISPSVFLPSTFAGNQSVNISPVVSNGWGGGFKNAASNMWLTLDQSVSMSVMMPGVVIGNYKKVPNKPPFYDVYQPIDDENNLKNGDWEKYVNNMKLVEAIGVGLQNGYIPYDENTTYEIPVDYKGRKLPIPTDANYTWKITYANKRIIPDKSGVRTDHSHPLSNENGTNSKYRLPDDTPITTPRDIFMVYSEYMWNSDLCYIKRGDWGGATNILTTQKCLKGAKVDSYIKNVTSDKTPTKLRDILSATNKGDFKMPITQRYIWSRYASDNGQDLRIDADVYKNGRYHELIPGLNKAGVTDGNLATLMLRENSCELAKKKRNCQIWSTFYSNRVLALKSGLALALYKNLVNDDGTYKDIRYGYQVFHRYIGNGRTIDNQIAKKFKQLKTTNLKHNNKENLKELYEWLFTYTAESQGMVGTKLRVTIADLFKDIQKNAINGQIFRKNLQDENSDKYTCRQNHNIMFTDGGWGENISDAEVDYNPAITTESTFNLPYIENHQGNEGYTKHKYSPMLPYKSTPSESNTMIHLADLAFKAWATDLDSNADNNTPKQGGSVVVPNKNDVETYVRADGTYGIYKNPNVSGEDKQIFWHPFYDLATW